MSRTATEHYMACEKCVILAHELNLESMIKLWKCECDKYLIQLDTYVTKTLMDD